jgi:TAG lipase / steryl ester hydrolase / phospholipase A2 / LPA acyltransferase
VIISATKRLERALNNASSYEEWKEAAQAYDARAGLDRWKELEQSRRYDYVAIRVWLDRLRALRAQQDNRGLLFNLNEGIHGNMGGMGRAALYEKARFGTKQLIVDYVDEIVSALEHLADPEVDDISTEEKLDFFHRADHCFGRTAFMMSGSGSLLYFHIGVVKALLEQNLLPDVMSGSSGGAFVGSLVSTRSDADLLEKMQPGNLVAELEEAIGYSKRSPRYKPSVMPIDEIRKIIERMIPDLTFQEALERTGRHLNISIAPAETHQRSRLLNAITSPNVYIREAVLASGAVPGVYPPVMLAAKDHLGERQAYLPSEKWVDGSVSDDMPAKRLARLYGVNHYVVSQTNPHVIPFVTDSKRRQDTIGVWKDAGTKTARALVNASATTLEKPLSLSPALARATNLWLSVINQDYVGDINILPANRYFNPFRVLAFLTDKEIRELLDAGERAAWPKIEMIRIQTRISRTLNRILSEFQRDHVLHVRGALRRRPR